MTQQERAAEISAVEQELTALLQMGVRLAVGPDRAGWLWHTEQSGAVVDILTGEVFPGRADLRSLWPQVAEVPA